MKHALFKILKNLAQSIHLSFFFFLSFCKIKLYFTHVQYIALILLIPNPWRETIIVCNTENVSQLLDFHSIRYVLHLHI